MKKITVLMICFYLVAGAGFSYGASAKCEVVKKDGNLLIMDCGKQAKGFQEKSKVKIKTDRGKR